MKVHLVILAVATALAFVPTVEARTVDELVADPAALKDELDRCHELGFSAESDARCKIANQAEDKRFMGGGVTYTPTPVQVYPNEPVPQTGTTISPVEKAR